MEPGAHHLAPRVAWWVAKCHGIGIYRLGLRGLVARMCLLLEKLFLYQKWRRWKWFILQMKHALRRKIPFLLRVIERIIFKYWKFLAYHRWKKLLVTKLPSKDKVQDKFLLSLSFYRQTLMDILRRSLLRSAIKRWLGFCVNGVNAEYALLSILQRKLLTRSLESWRQAFRKKLAIKHAMAVFKRYHLKRAWARWLNLPKALRLDSSAFLTPLHKARDQVCDCIYRICTGSHCRCKLVTHAKLRMKTLGNYIEYAKAANQASETVKRRSRIKATPISRSADISGISTASADSRSHRKYTPSLRKASTNTGPGKRTTYTPRKSVTPSGRIEGHRGLDSSIGYMSLKSSLSLTEQSFDRSLTSSFSHWDLSPFQNSRAREEGLDGGTSRN